MFKITRNTTVYVVCPSFNKTGGTELAHQLVYEINRQGGKAFITYYSDGKSDPEINPAFLNYVSSFTTVHDVIDSNENIIILPEINQSFADNFTNIQKGIWWMSVDNYLKRNGIKGHYKYFGFLRTIKHLITGNIKIGGYPIDNEIIHLYQSEYAYQYIASNGASKCYRLSDYINQSYLIDEISEKSLRDDIVLYNPKKGIDFTKKLIAKAPNLNWIPIENMTTEEVKELLRKSKVYIDFGNHPGKDRFPREAAISGCCVITGKRGSAAFYNDIPINDEYKFEDIDENLESIINKIKSCIINYDDHNLRFSEYREFIKCEYQKFQQDVNTLFIYN